MMWLFDGDKEMPLQLKGSNKNHPKTTKTHPGGWTSQFSSVFCVARFIRFIDQEFPTPAPQAKRPKSWPRPRKWRYLGVESFPGLQVKLNKCGDTLNHWIFIWTTASLLKISTYNWKGRPFIINGVKSNITNGTTTTQLNRNWFVLSSYNWFLFWRKNQTSKPPNSKTESNHFRSWGSVASPKTSQILVSYFIYIFLRDNKIRDD